MIPLTITENPKPNIAEFLKSLPKVEERKPKFTIDKFVDFKNQGFKYGVRPYRPGYIDIQTDPSEIFGANSLEEVFNAPYIKRWTQNPQVDMVGISSKYYHGAERMIRAFCKDNTHWVVGFFTELSDYDKEEFI